MGFYIPKIEYLNVDTTGNTTNGNGTLSNIPDTSNIEVGMFARGTGIPSGAEVASKTASTVTLANGVLATASGTGVDLEFGYKIEFDYPPVEKKGESKAAKSTTSTSISGVQQVSIQHIEATRALNFSFLSETIKGLLVDFLDEHALYGNEFRYYEDKTGTSYLDYELDDGKYDPKIVSPKGLNLFVWEIALKFRRVL